MQNIITLDAQTVTKERDENTSRRGFTSSYEGTAKLQKFITASGLNPDDPLVQWRAERTRSWMDGLYVADPVFDDRQLRELRQTYARDGLQSRYDQIIRDNNLPTHIQVGDRVERLEDAIRDPGVWHALRSRFWDEDDGFKKFDALAILEFAVSTEHLARRLTGQEKPIPYMTHVKGWQEKLTNQFNDVRDTATKKWQEVTAEDGVLTTAFKSAGEKIDQGFKEVTAEDGFLGGIFKRVREGLDEVRQKIHVMTAPPVFAPVKTQPEECRQPHARFEFVPPAMRRGF